jgi:hypothetical protein
VCVDDALWWRASEEGEGKYHGKQFFVGAINIRKTKLEATDRHKLRKKKEKSKEDGNQRQKEMMVGTCGSRSISGRR